MSLHRLGDGTPDQKNNLIDHQLGKYMIFLFSMGAFFPP